MGDRLDTDATDLAARLRFELPGGGHALFTSRADGNLSTLRGPGHERGRRERDRLCEELWLRWLCASRQVHGVYGAAPEWTPARPRARRAARGDRRRRPRHRAARARGDGVGGRLPACDPRVRGAVAALHAGWRGLAGGVLEEGVRALRELGGEGRDRRRGGPWRRPAAATRSGEEVHAAFGDRPPRRGATSTSPALARDCLQAAGVAQVEDAGVCTICDERLYSHRREGLAAGRQAGVAWLS